MHIIESVVPGNLPAYDIFEGTQVRPALLRLQQAVMTQQVLFGPVRQNYFGSNPAYSNLRRATVEQLEMVAVGEACLGSVVGCVTCEAEDLLIDYAGTEVTVPAGPFPVAIQDSSNIYASLVRFFDLQDACE